MLFYPPSQVAKTLIEAKADVQKTDSHFGFFVAMERRDWKKGWVMLFSGIKCFPQWILPIYIYMYIHYLYSYFLHICILIAVDYMKLFDFF